MKCCKTHTEETNSEMSLFNGLNRMAETIHNNAKEKGFYDKIETDDQYLARALMNLHSEISELWESHRKGEITNLCNKAKKMEELGLKPLVNLEEELADIVIRVLDTSERMGVNIEEAVTIKHEINKIRPYRHGNKKA